MTPETPIPPSATPKLTAALIRAQRAFKPALKTSYNPHFKSHYADLHSVNEAVDDALWQNGLTVTQTCDVRPEGVVLLTRLLHESGEELASVYPLLPAKDRDPQALGACMTYARRYCKAAIVGLASEDDDGNAASDRGQSDKPVPATSRKVARPVALAARFPKAVSRIASATTEDALKSAEHWAEGLDGDHAREARDLIARRRAELAAPTGGGA